MTETEFMRQFGDNLTFVMKRSHMSQNELSKATGINRTSINRYVNGERIPPLKNVINMANVMNCDIDELIDVDELIE